jgi:ribonuclease J
MNQNIVFFALGGMDEKGKALYVLGVDDKYLVFDAGCLNPQNSVLGVKKIIPDLS